MIAYGEVGGWEEEEEVDRNIGRDRRKNKTSNSTRLLRKLLPSTLEGEAEVEEGRKAGLFEAIGEGS